MEAYDKLVEKLKELNKVAVAFSAGVDSTFLLDIANEILPGRVLAISISSACMAQDEKDKAVAFCKQKQIPLSVIQADPLSLKEFRENPKDRCYHCKKMLFQAIVKEAQDHGFEFVIEGSNYDDLSDYRPGMKALRELNILSPMQQAGLTKAQIRSLSAKRGLESANMPSLACLASRIPYGEEITLEKLEMVEQAESYLFEQGFSQLRVRSHHNLARIELLPSEIEKLMKDGFYEQVTKRLKEIGFSYVTLDLQGFRSGSLNEGVDKK